MKRALLLALLAAGCSLNPDAWYKPGATPEQRAAQIKRCEYEVKVAGHHMIPLFIACMEQAGYTQDLSHRTAVRADQAARELERSYRPVPNGFRDLRFGDRPLPGMTLLSATDSISTYVREADERSVFGGVANLIEYTFTAEGFRSVVIEYPESMREALSSALSEDWGEPSERPDGNRVIWRGKHSTATFSRHENGMLYVFIRARDSRP